jgi:hypothetical protein
LHQNWYRIYYHLVLHWKRQFLFIFSVMVGWIQMIFGIQMYHEGKQVKFKHGCGPIIIGGICIFIYLQLLNCWNNFTESW